MIRLWLPSFCSDLLAELRFIFFGRVRPTFFSIDSTSLHGLVFGLDVCLSNEFLYGFCWGTYSCSFDDLLSNYFVLVGRGRLSEYCWVWEGRYLDLFSNFGWVFPDRGVDLCLPDNFLSIFGGLSRKRLILWDFCKWVPRFSGIHPFPPHEYILYPVWVSQLLSHNMDAMKNCPNLSYFVNWSYYFPVSKISL